MRSPKPRGIRKRSMSSIFWTIRTLRARPTIAAMRPASWDALTKELTTTLSRSRLGPLGLARSRDVGLHFHRRWRRRDRGLRRRRRIHASPWRGRAAAALVILTELGG